MLNGMKAHPEAPSAEKIAALLADPRARVNDRPLNQGVLAQLISQELQAMGIPGAKVSNVTVSRWVNGVTSPDPMRGAALLRIMAKIEAGKKLKVRPASAR